MNVVKCLTIILIELFLTKKKKERKKTWRILSERDGVLFRQGRQSLKVITRTPCLEEMALTGALTLLWKEEKVWELDWIPILENGRMFLREYIIKRPLSNQWERSMERQLLNKGHTWSLFCTEYQEMCLRTWHDNGDNLQYFISFILPACPLPLRL